MKKQYIIVELNQSIPEAILMHDEFYDSLKEAKKDGIYNQNGYYVIEVPKLLNKPKNCKECGRSKVK